MVTERRAVRWTFAASVAATLLFVVAVRFAPEEEIAYRSNPYQEPRLAGNLVATTPESQVKAVLYLEEEAALRGDASKALRLWDPQGAIRDAAYTPDNPLDDRVWSGEAAIRQRYQDEFHQRRYLELAHTDASVIVEGDRAVVVNDLRAEVLGLHGIQRIFLSRGDRWVFRKTPQGWKIVELTVNRTPR